jgi:MiaB/RimO family radical SAM methylthiotransferase
MPTMIPKKVYVFTYGCPNRYLDGERYKRFFVENGYEAAENPEHADLVLVNTCAFRKAEEDIGIAKIKEFQKRLKKGGQIIVCGCLPAINKKRLNEVFSGMSFLPKEKNLLSEALAAKVPLESLEDANVFKFQAPKTIKELAKSIMVVDKQDFAKKVALYVKKKALHRRAAADDTRFYLRIADGCLGKCSYCAIKFAIGNLKSKPLDEVMREFRKGLTAGYRRFVLVSDDTGAYGMDCGTSLAELLQKMLAAGPKDMEIEIEEVNIQWLVRFEKELTPLLQDARIKYLLVAVQSGSDRVLKAMNRALTTAEQNAGVLRRLKEARPGLRLRAQYIVGFPGETEADAAATVKSIAASGVDEANLFKFDPKPNTPAFTMDGQVPPKRIDARIAKMAKELAKHGVKALTNN